MLREERQRLQLQQDWEGSHPVLARLTPVPDSKLLEAWDLWILLLVIVFAILTPLDIAFDLGSELDGLMVMLDICFILDFLVGFRKAFLEARGPSTRQRAH